MQSDFARTGAAVRFYLDKYDLFEDAEVELVKRGDRAMLDVYIAKHLLGPDAENLIVSVFLTNGYGWVWVYFNAIKTVSGNEPVSFSETGFFVDKNYNRVSVGRLKMNYV